MSEANLAESSGESNGSEAHDGDMPVIDLGTEDIEKYLRVGAMSIIDTQPNESESQRYEGAIVGWRPNAFIVFQTRVDPQNPWRVVHEDVSVLRFFVNGRACAIKTYVMDWQARGSNRIVFLTWPEEVRYRIIRKEARLETELLCEVKLESEDELWGTVLQLSNCGCRIYLPMKNVDDKPVKMTFALPNGIEIANLEIDCRHATLYNDGVMFGCESNRKSIDPKKRSVLKYFVDTALHLQGPLKESNRAGILLAKKGEKHQKLLSSFREHKLDVSIAYSVIECFGRLQTQGSGLLLISGDLADLPVLEVLRIVKAADGFRSTPIYVYGGNESELKPAVESKGAKYLPSLDATPEILEMVTGILQKSSLA